MQADFYCTILGLFENDRMWLGDTFYQICFITHHPNANEIEEQVCWEWLSPVPQDGHKYSDGVLLQYISGISHSLWQSSSKPDQSIVTNKLVSLESATNDLDGKELFNYYAHGIDIDNFSSTFSKFDLNKSCVFCGSLSHSNNYTRVTSIWNPESKYCHQYHTPGDWNKIKSSLISGQLPQMVLCWDPRQISRQVPSWKPRQVPSWDPSQVPRQIPSWSPSKVPGQVAGWDPRQVSRHISSLDLQQVLGWQLQQVTSWSPFFWYLNWLILYINM